MSAWASEHRLVLGQCAVDSKSNEITAIPVLLEQLSLTGCIVSIDAMGTHSAIAQQIHQQKADYILALKDNQPTLSKQAHQWFEQFQATSDTGVDYTQHQQCEAGHHRIESRTVFEFPVAQVFTSTQCKEWAGLHTLVVVQSRAAALEQGHFRNSLFPEFAFRRCRYLCSLYSRSLGH